MHKLKEVIISITNRCNSSCRICDVPKDKLEELPTSCWEKVIKDASLVGASTIVFSGGEPLLRDDICELISYTKNCNMSACITSNGLLIDERCASNLANSGVNVVNVSIEGPQEAHDYLRGEGSFEKVISALSNLKKYNIETTVATVVSRYNYKYLTYITQLAAEYGVTTIKFQPFSSLFLKDKSRMSDFLLSPKEATGLGLIIREVIAFCGKQGIQTNPLPYLEKLPLYSSGSASPLNKACKALWVSCPIRANGNIYPCWVLNADQDLIGSVKDKRLMALWHSAKRDSILDRIKKEGCGGCLLSCYDDALGQETIERKIALNVNKLKREGLRGYARKSLKKWFGRIRFYSSYRGSLKTVMKRSMKLLERKNRLIRQNKEEINRKEIAKALDDISAAKEMLEEQMKLK